MDRALVGCTTLIHCATCYGRNGETREAVYAANVEYPRRLVRHAMMAGVTAVIDVGTCLPPGTGTYASSKRAWRDELCISAVTDGLAVAVLELQHLYGRGCDRRNFVTRVVQDLLAGAEVLTFTRGSQRRDFLHLDDAVAAIAIILRQGLPAPGSTRSYGLGSGRSIPVRELVERLARMVGGATRLDFGAVPDRPGEPADLVADIADVVALGWSPLIDLECGLEDLVRFLRAQKQLGESSCASL